MNNQLLLLLKKHTDTLIEQTKSKPQETLGFKIDKQNQTFLFNPQIYLIEETKWLFAVTSYECTNSVFNLTKGNNSFSINIPVHWNSDNGEQLINEFSTFLELRSENIMSCM